MKLSDEMNSDREINGQGTDCPKTEHPKAEHQKAEHQKTEHRKSFEFARLSHSYRVRRLEDSDIPAILTFCLGNPKYYHHCPPEPSEESIRQDMTALPPNKHKEDKYYLGFFDGETLVAVLDLILGFPNEDTAFWGFFMMNREYQGRGIGTKLVEEIIACLREEFSYIRLGYVKGNEQSEHFWEKNSFCRTGVESKTDDYVIVIMERTL